MAILDILKKKKPAKSPQKREIRRSRQAVELSAGKPRKEKESLVLEASPGPKKISGIAYRILKSSHVTEKATDLTKKDQYIFKVGGLSNKLQVKKAIEDLYGVGVVSVRVIRVPRKRRRLGRIEGWRGGYKKAIVRLKGGQKIEVLPR